MDLREDRWFVRFRGHTLGPLTAEQIKASLKTKEIGESDKVASARNPSWIRVGDHPDFAAFAVPQLRPEIQWAPLPPPQTLYRKKTRAPLPAQSQAWESTFLESGKEDFSRVHEAVARRSGVPLEREEKPALRRAAPAAPQAPAPKFSPKPEESKGRETFRSASAPAPATKAPTEALAALPKRPPPIVRASALAPAGAEAGTPIPERYSAFFRKEVHAKKAPPAPKAAPVVEPQAEPVAPRFAEPSVEAAPAPVQIPVAEFPKAHMEALEDLMPLASDLAEESMPAARATARQAPEVSKAENGPAKKLEALALALAEANPASPFASAAAPSPQAQEKLAVDALSLLESLRDWRRQEEELGRTIREKKNVIPEAPPEAQREPALRVAEAPSSPEPARLVALDATDLRVSISKRTFLKAAVITAVLAVAVLAFVLGTKSRGPEGFRFPDPSSPSISPSDQNDPNSGLRAPTRPQRD